MAMGEERRDGKESWLRGKGDGVGVRFVGACFPRMLASEAGWAKLGPFEGWVRCQQEPSDESLCTEIDGGLDGGSAG